MKKIKRIPEFESEDDERNFWAKHDLIDYFDLDKAIRNPKFPNLKLSTKTITFRVTENLLNDLKVIANKKDVPYQSLIKIYLDEKVKEEYRHV